MITNVFVIFIFDICPASELSNCNLVIHIDGLPIAKAFSNFLMKNQRRPLVLDDHIDLLDCFEKFTDSEVLGANDLWFCRRCDSHKRATKKFDLWKLPDVLIIQLKRFRSNYRFHDKNDSFINFPIT